MVKPSAQMVARMRAQHREWIVRRDQEFARTVEYVADRLPQWRDHPYLGVILWEWYAPRAGDLPVGWYPFIVEECRRFFAQLPWPQREETQSLSLAKCREALGPTARDLSDAQVRFLRDQLYVLAETVVDGCKGAPQ